MSEFRLCTHPDHADAYISGEGWIVSDTAGEAWTPDEWVNHTSVWEPADASEREAERLRHRRERDRLRKARKYAKQRAARQQRIGKPVLDAMEVAELRWRWRDGDRPKILAEAYGVNVRTVYRYVRYREVTPFRVGPWQAYFAATDTSHPVRLGRWKRVA